MGWLSGTIGMGEPQVKQVDSIRASNAWRRGGGRIHYLRCGGASCKCRCRKNPVFVSGGAGFTALDSSAGRRTWH